MTSAAIALDEERSLVLESMPVEAAEVADRRGLPAGIALATIALVQLSWLGTLGYFAFTILR